MDKPQEVEKILSKQKFREEWKYLVKWKDFPIEDSTWELLENLQDNMKFIEDYEEQLRNENMYYKPKPKIVSNNCNTKSINYEDYEDFRDEILYYSDDKDPSDDDDYQLNLEGCSDDSDFKVKKRGRKKKIDTSTDKVEISSWNKNYIPKSKNKVQNSNGPKQIFVSTNNNKNCLNGNLNLLEKIDEYRGISKKTNNKENESNLLYSNNILNDVVQNIQKKRGRKRKNPLSQVEDLSEKTTGIFSTDNKLSIIDVDDIPLKIITAKSDDNQITCLVEWKCRSDGIKPENSWMPSLSLKKYYPEVLIDFYMSNLKFSAPAKK